LLLKKNTLPIAAGSAEKNVMPHHRAMKTGTVAKEFCELKLRKLEILKSR